MCMKEYTVVLDYLLYQRRLISLCSFFSVTVLVFLIGITSYFSSKRHEGQGISDKLIRKVKGIMIQHAQKNIEWKTIFFIKNSR